ncbi:MAG: hypothetical protein IPP07_25465 [Holophagales bacterium]|nr:hypothetical protein [Holophagales bacterium]
MDLREKIVCREDVEDDRFKKLKEDRVRIDALRAPKGKRVAGLVHWQLLVAADAREQRASLAGFCPEERQRVIGCVVRKDDAQAAVTESELDVDTAFSSMVILDVVVVVPLNERLELVAGCSREAGRGPEYLENQYMKRDSAFARQVCPELFNVCTCLRAGDVDDENYSDLVGVDELREITRG